MYREVPRTQGISTTQLIKKVLGLKINESPYTGSSLLLSANVIKEFSKSSVSSVNAFNKIYVQGSFDLYHPGHLDFLKAAKARGDYLIVGVYDDETVKMLNFGKSPYMTLHERALTIMGCRFVDDVIIGAPYIVSEELMDYFHVSLVVAGQHDHLPGENGQDPFYVPAAAGKFVKIDSGNALTTQDIAKRIEDRAEELCKSTQHKERIEAAIITN